MSNIESVAVLMLQGQPQKAIATTLGISEQRVSDLVKLARERIAAYDSRGVRRNQGGRPRGTRSPVIPDAVVEEIRSRLSSGETMRDIAAERGVSPQSIHALIKRRTPC